MIADPAVPRRDALLRPETMAGVISQRLLGGVPVERCERVYVKYRVGESLRVVYRYDGDATSRRAPASATASPRPRSAPRSIPSRTTASCRPRGLQPVAQRLLGQPVTTRLVAWAAEQSATAECRDAGGTRGRLRQGRRDRRAPRLRRRSPTAHVRVPRVLGRAPTASSCSKRSTAAASTTSTRRCDAPRRDPRRHLHAARNINGDSPSFHRGSIPTRLATAAEVIATRAARRRARRAAAARSGCSSASRTRSASRAASTATRTSRNALLLADGEVALLDLEHLSRGPAAADLGQVLAGADRQPARRAREGAAARLRHPPDRAALRWHTAASLLARSRCPRSAATARSCSPGCASCSTPAPRSSPDGGRRMKPALLFYCQHSVGLGHLMRSLRAVRGARRALPRRAARRRRAARGHRAAARRRARRAAAAGREGGDGFGSGDPRYTTERAWEIRAQRIHDDAATTTRRRSSSSSCSRSGARSSPASSSRCSRRRARRARSPPAACATSSSARARTSASTTTARASSPTRTWTLSSSTATRASPASRRRSSRSTPLTSPSTTRASSPAQRHQPPRARRAHRRLRRRRPRRRAAAQGGDAAPPNGRPMRAIAGPLMPHEDYDELRSSAPDQRRAAALRPGPRRTS